MQVNTQDSINQGLKDQISFGNISYGRLKGIPTKRTLGQPDSVISEDELATKYALKQRLRQDLVNAVAVNDVSVTQRPITHDKPVDVLLETALLTPRQEVEPAQPATETKKRPAGFDMTDEELADTGNIDFEEQQEKKESANADTPPSGQSLSEDILHRLLQKEKILSESATKPVVFSPALISRGDVGVIGRSTVNIIQGAFGSHKSRLAELLASLMLTTHDANDPQFLGFVRAVMERFCVCYLDTERNKREELPHAIQGIKVKAGYSLADQPTDFRFTSIKGEKRADRFNAIELFIRHVRQQTPLHLFCLIDVVTDAIGDFNDPKQSMQLFDFLGNLSDDYNATFLLVIHQNPGTEKARGHAGTEAANKASTVLQIGFEKDANGNDTDLIRLRYLKLRRGKRPEPVYLCYSDEVKGLVLANDSQVAANTSQRQQKAPIEEVADSLIKLLSKGAIQKNEIWASLETEFGAGNATIRNRIKTIMDEQPQMFDDEGRAVRLTDFTTDKSHFYKLSLLE